MQGTVAAPSFVTIVASWFALGFIALLGVTVLVYIWTGRINLSRLLSEPNGDASMSRFQLLVFTFIIAASFFLVVASPNPPKLPDVVPQGVLLLLGISSSSYLVSKSIQFSREEGVSEKDVSVGIAPKTPQTTRGGATIAFSATVTRAADQTVTWSVDAPALGSIHPKTGVYTPPPAGSQPGTDTVRATSIAEPGAFDITTVTIA